MDVYLNWAPALALGLGLLVLLVRPSALPAALPILLLWACSKQVAQWLDRNPLCRATRPPSADVRFLRRAALHTWRYFSEFSTEEHNWLDPRQCAGRTSAMAARVSPTNLGLLLNARQAACEFGYLTVPEFAEQTLRTLATVSALRKYRGHLLNWYDTRTLQPLAPAFVSSVDSGNLLASVWTLQQGCLEQLRQPLLQPRLSEGLLDHLRLLAKVRAFPRKLLVRSLKDNSRQTIGCVASSSCLTSFSSNLAWWSPSRNVLPRLSGSLKGHSCGFIGSTRRWIDYAPWCLPEFASLREEPAVNLRLMDNISSGTDPGVHQQISADGWQAAVDKLVTGTARFAERLSGLLPGARA